LAALGALGDASTVPVLAQAAAGSEANEQNAARESLYSLRGSAIDSAIASAIGSSSGKTQLELIKAAGERPSPAAADVLMRVAQGSDRDASKEAVRALRNAAGGAQVPALLDAVLKMQNAADRREGALTLASVIKRAAHPPVGPVLAAYQSASDPQIRVVLLDVMGQVSAAEALPVLRSNLASSDPEISRAAVLALSAWQDPSPIPDLLALAKDASIPTRQILALRGLIKVIGAPSNRSFDETVSLLGQAMALAKEPAEKRAILAVLPIYPAKAGLQMAEAAMKDSSVVREAKAAADSIRELVSQ
jgi:HEAT repeat protein